MSLFGIAIRSQIEQIASLVTKRHDIGDIESVISDRIRFAILEKNK